MKTAIVLSWLLSLALLPPAPARAQCAGGSCAARGPLYHPVYYAATVPPPTPAIPGSGPGAECWVWLRRQRVFGWGYRLASGPHAGLWRIQPGSKRASLCGPLVRPSASSGQAGGPPNEPGLDPAVLRVR